MGLSLIDDLFLLDWNIFNNVLNLVVISAYSLNRNWYSLLNIFNISLLIRNVLDSSHRRRYSNIWLWTNYSCSLIKDFLIYQLRLLNQTIFTFHWETWLAWVAFGSWWLLIMTLGMLIGIDCRTPGFIWFCPFWWMVYLSWLSDEPAFGFTICLTIESAGRLLDMKLSLLDGDSLSPICVVITIGFENNKTYLS